MIKVGSPASYRISEHGRKNVVNYTYRDVFFDPEGWANAEKYLPRDLDLVSLKLDDGEIICGWYTGTEWDGYKIKPETVVKRWRRIMEDKKQKKIEKKKNKKTKCKAV